MYASPFTPDTEDYPPPGRASGQRKVVNPGWSWPAVDTGCTCEASQPRWKSSPGRGGPGGPLTSGSLEGSKGGQPSALKHQHTLLDLNGPGKDAHVKNRDILHYRREKNWIEMGSVPMKQSSALLYYTPPDTAASRPAVTGTHTFGTDRPGNTSGLSLGSHPSRERRQLLSLNCYERNLQFAIRNVIYTQRIRGWKLQENIRKAALQPQKCF